MVLFLGKPGMWLQKLTTREPDDGMIEVAIASVEAVFDWRAYQAGIRKELSRRKRHKKHREREEKKVIPEDIVQDADYEQSFAAPDPETSMELSAEDEKAFDRPQESKKAEKASTAKKSKAEEEAKEEKTSATQKKSRTEKAEKSSTGKKTRQQSGKKRLSGKKAESLTADRRKRKVFLISFHVPRSAVNWRSAKQDTETVRQSVCARSRSRRKERLLMSGHIRRRESGRQNELQQRRSCQSCSLIRIRTS